MKKLKFSPVINNGVFTDLIKFSNKFVYYLTCYSDTSI